MAAVVNCSLLIDDDKATNFFNKYLLLKHGAFKCIKSVDGGDAALKYLQNIDENLTEKPELIFLDLNMPAMNGWSFLKEFGKLEKKLISNTKIIILSTSTDPYDQKKAIENEFVQGFINKPLSMDLVDKIINRNFSHRIAK